ncbi:hypothetical protein [Mesorhizobium sp. M4B.F.Ca.ET.049.02.1.2]|uniref:hypothetical protein n=1 Tax=Mesorhizobium sp. M4B.F.Ca.ET.049.02.1.2 TaxID=2496752 RepID=UPI000FCB85D3|nr:hypothetical protein [Mesorhizobium sp. M4B.F.Ca.ET.049.02.1.2]RUW76613.1 hypothetical protein EOA31_06485 [Mesorhizobium sp. M4B.F.Ca.ET.049.02.1.2]
MGHVEDVTAAVSQILSFLFEKPLTKNTLGSHLSGHKRGVFDRAIGALRILGLIEIDAEKLVSLSSLGRYFVENPNGLDASDIVSESFQHRKADPGAAAREYGYPTVDSLRRQIGKIAERETASLQTSRNNAHRMRLKTTRSDLRFGIAMFIAAIDREFERRAHDLSYDGRFRWPETDAPGGDGSVGGVQFMDEGMLLRMEYRVGVRNGVSTPVRRQILRQLFEDALPPVFPPDYMRKWGDKGTVQRLRTLAYTIAPLAKNLKRKHDSRNDVAIGEYESDLKWLYDTYYVGRFHFDWPSTRLD